MPFTDLHLLVPEFTYSAFLSITKDKISALLPKAELSTCIPNFSFSHRLKNNSPETDPHYIIHFTLTIASFSSVCKYAIISPILATPVFTLFLSASSPFLYCLLLQNSSKNMSILIISDYSTPSLPEIYSNHTLSKLLISRSQMISILLNFIAYSQSSSYLAL